MLRIKSSKLAPTLAFVLSGALAVALSMSACATSQKAFIGDEGGLDEAGLPIEGGPNEEGGGGEGGADSGPGSPRIACGPTFCRSDAKCVSNACTYDCTGTKVPGDYATITSAVTALAATAADVTICLGAIQAGETVSISDVGAHNKALKIIATAPLQTTLGSVSVAAGFSEVTLIGFGTSSTLNISGAAKVNLRGLKLQSVSGVTLQIRTTSGVTTPSSITVDGCDIGSSTTSGYGVYIDSTYASPLDVSITNSYIHGGSYGVYQYGSSATLTMKLVNNTIDKATYGINLSGSGASAISYVNNIISNSTMVGVMVGTSLTAVTHSNNALFGNITNFSGSAVEGAGYVKSDCQLDMATGVPQTKVGSPCRGVGKADGAPAVDFWNASRGSKVDIGAVQGP